MEDVDDNCPCRVDRSGIVTEGDQIPCIVEVGTGLVLPLVRKLLGEGGVGQLPELLISNGVPKDLAAPIGVVRLDTARRRWRQVEDRRERDMGPAGVDARKEVEVIPGKIDRLLTGDLLKHRIRAAQIREVELPSLVGILSNEVTRRLKDQFRPVEIEGLGRSSQQVLGAIEGNDRSSIGFGHLPHAVDRVPEPMREEFPVEVLVLVGGCPRKVEAGEKDQNLPIATEHRIGIESPDGKVSRGVNIAGRGHLGVLLRRKMVGQDFGVAIGRRVLWPLVEGGEGGRPIGDRAKELASGEKRDHLAIIADRWGIVGDDLLDRLSFEVGSCIGDPADRRGSRATRQIGDIDLVVAIRIAVSPRQGSVRDEGDPGPVATDHRGRVADLEEDVDIVIRIAEIGGIRDLHDPAGIDIIDPDLGVAVEIVAVVIVDRFEDEPLPVIARPADVGSNEVGRDRQGDDQNLLGHRRLNRHARLGHGKTVQGIGHTDEDTPQKGSFHALSLLT